MKKLILLIFLFLPICGFSQFNSQKDTLTFEAGKELVKFYRVSSTGTGLMLFGGILAGIGFADKQPMLGMKVGGIAMAAVGTIMTFSASRHVGNAGQLLMYLSGKPIPLRGRRKNQ